MKITCGVFIINSNNDVLLVHPVNAPWNKWSIPKGLNEEGEKYTESAIREVKEETNIDLNINDLKYIGSIKYKKQSKYLEAYYVYLNSDGSEYDLKCDSTFVTKKGEVLPENNEIKWFNIVTAKEMIHETQLEMFNKIL